MNLFFTNKYLEALERIYAGRDGSAEFVVLTGRHKVGKTTILTEFLRNKEGLFITLTNKSAHLQLSDVSNYLRNTNFIGGFIPSFKNWKEFFEFILYISRDRDILLALDEFQNMDKSDRFILQELSSLLSKDSGDSKLMLIASSADAEFIYKAFNPRDGILRGQATSVIEIEPLTFGDVLKLYSDNGSKLSMAEILRIYAVFGGIPKYYALFSQFGFWNAGLNELLSQLVFRHFAPLGFEFKEMIIREFTRNNTIYLSLLQAIAAGSNTVTEIAGAVSIPATSVMKYVTELERKKGLIKRKNPIGTDDPSRSKFGKYYIANPFENFWFRFVQPFHVQYEMGQYESITSRLEAEIGQYIQAQLPRIIREIIAGNRDSQLLANIIGGSGSSLGEAWTREAAFDLAVYNRARNELVLGRLVTNFLEVSQLTFDNFVADIKVVSRQYPGFSFNKLLILPSEPEQSVVRELESRKIGYITIPAIFSLLEFLPAKEGTTRIPSYAAVGASESERAVKERTLQQK